VRQTARFLLLLAGGILVYSVGGYLATIPRDARTAIKVALPLALLLLTHACARVEVLRPWRTVCLAFLAASCGFLAAWVLSDRLLGALGVTPTSVSGVALAKLTESVLIVGALLLVARAGGMSLGDLYLRRGKTRAWVLIGLVSFAVFLALFLLQWSRQGLTTAALLRAAPWILMFVLANGFLEELHFRGLLLRPYEGFLGAQGANFCIALFFTLAHAPVQYAPDIVPFLAVLFALAWAWGFVIQRTEALWGAVLFHAGADLLIILGIFKTYGADQGVRL
jgi:uncharacterized protein